MKTLVKGGTLIYGGAVKQEDVLIIGRKIADIKTTINPSGDEEIIDASSSFVLPGFIATSVDREEDAAQHGVTTLVKKIMDQEDGMKVQSSIDFVFQVRISRLTQEVLHWLDEMRVKVIELEEAIHQEMNWDLWEPRLRRSGMVISLPSDRDPFIKDLTLPMVIPFGSKRHKSRARTIFQISRDHLPLWEKQAKRKDPFLSCNHWLDVQEYLLPKLSKEKEIPDYLMKLVKTRSSVPAKLFGIYPKKGSIRIGADADIMLVSMDHLVSHFQQPLKPTHVWLKGVRSDQLRSGDYSGEWVKSNQTYAFSF